MMGKSRRPFLRSLLFALTSALVLAMPTLAQDPPLALDQVVGHPRGLPQLPPQGAWGEVINVTSRWLVIQNHSGQQFPIAIDDIGEFMVRWPSGLDLLGAQSLVEAVGRDLGSNVVEAAHVDVFEGADRSLVAPTFNSMLPNNTLVTAVDPTFNKLISPWDIPAQNMLYGWAYPVPAGIYAIPTKTHVVGSVLQRNPLRLAVPGNNVATIVAGENEVFTVTQVTRGSINYVRKGDYAFLMPQSLNPKGLVVSQLVLYKAIPFGRFNPAAR
jgi:hypothetical protein